MFTNPRRHPGVLLCPMLLQSSLAFAQSDAAGASPLNSGDIAWMIVSSALVLFMTPGLALFYGGMVRRKNVLATVMQSMIAIPVLSMVWMVVGYSLAFSPTNGGWIGGLDWVFLRGVGQAPNPDYAATVPHDLFMVFQCMFAVITPPLVTGAFAERMKFSSYLVFIVAWSLLIYCPLAHWVWGVGGMLRTQGVLDFAGGLVVHLSAGVSALAAALVFGPRVDYHKVEVVPYSPVLVMIGTAVLWFGWFGFNAGSAIGSNDIAALAFTNTHFAAASAAVVWLGAEWSAKGKPTLVGSCIAMVVGLAAVTPAAGFIDHFSAIAIGAATAIISFSLSIIRAKSKLDDTLDVFACHGISGVVGVLATGLLSSKAINAAATDGGSAFFMTQFKALLIVGAFCFVMTTVILKVIEALMGLRVTAEEEERGLDETQHGEVVEA